MKNTQKKGFKQRCKDLWKYFTTYEKIWFFSILVLAVIFSFVFPETDDPTYTVNISKSAYESTADGTYNAFDFTGTVGEFVIVGITVDGEEFAMLDISDYAEFTVDPSEPDNALKFIPKLKEDGNAAFKLNKNSSISIEFYQDSDGDNDHLAVTVCVGNEVDGKVVTDRTQSLFTLSNITLDDVSPAPGSSQLYSMVENAQYPVAVWVITVLYLADVVLNIACELLISKQSKWNFIVSLFVEIVEILVCILCAYRFATMAVTLLFWIPCDIISFVLWHRHPDKQKEELTVVKKLTWWQDILIVAGIAVWTVGVGYLLTLIEVEGGIFANNVMLKNIVCYIDACASAVGIANGLLILFRYREQWIAWYIVAVLETVINIIAGQWVLLILKLGYLTNTTYGYIRWTQYIRSHKQNGELIDTTTQPVAATENG